MKARFSVGDGRASPAQVPEGNEFDVRFGVIAKVDRAICIPSIRLESWRRALEVVEVCSLYRFLEATVAGYMTTPVKTVPRDLSMADLQERFDRDDFNAYPVVENDDVIGVVSKFDFLKCFAFTSMAILPHYENLMRQTVADVMTSEFIYVSPATKLTRVLQLMVEHRLRSAPVIATERQLAGVIAREDIMRALKDAVGPRHPQA